MIQRLELVVQPSVGLEPAELLQGLVERHNFSTLLRRGVVAVAHVERSGLLFLGAKDYVAVNLLDMLGKGRETY